MECGKQTLQMENPVAEKSSGQQLEDLLHEFRLIANQLHKAAFHFPTDEKLLPAGHRLLRLLTVAGPKTVPDIARQFDSSRQNIQILVNRLERMRCVQLQPNPAHSKSDLVEITGNGRTMLDASTLQQEQLVGSLSPIVSDGEIQSTRQFLRRLREVLAHTHESRSAAPRTSSRPRRASGTTKTVWQQNQAAAESSEDENALPFNLL